MLSPVPGAMDSMGMGMLPYYTPQQHGGMMESAAFEVGFRGSKWRVRGL